MNDYVKSDLFRYYGKCDFKTFVKGYLRNRNFRFQYALRMCQTTGMSRLWGEFLYKLNRDKKFLQIPKAVKSDMACISVIFLPL